ncbi:hypothetical protein [Halodesulfovibrio spirochaetisodalis]|uniref:Uncharacterized protein n=1 Tax=Halodesulfovibrio spirochaetisodalis TaxID=1560234 RepID=A0A1B7XPP2_9BACT|nr:hypothetical protein [Halodesulfovibrio spirochaetisodalis]OBQ57482.1 hypothetical protein SP90_00045 [Halodesulfovibrio spirochaetisodalis]
MRTPLYTTIIRYIKVAPFPHATALTLLFVATTLYLEAHFLLNDGIPFYAIVLFILSALFGWGVILCQADAFSRFREFKRIKAIFSRRGFNPRILKLVSTSRCQRDAALLAAKETGCKHLAATYFKKMGYRWYHIIPDAIVENPMHFFNPVFLRTTFLPRKDTLTE